MKLYTIYGIRYLKADRIVYVGYSGNFKKRKTEHFTLSKRKDEINKKQQIHNFISFMGIENFVVEILFEDAMGLEDAYEKEISLVKHYDTFLNGLNENEGGNSVAPGKHNPNARRVICETTGETFSSVTEASNKFGFRLTELSLHLSGKDYKNGIGKRKLGKPHFFKYLDRKGDNRTISDETRKKMSERMTRQNSKKVLNKTTGKIYNSLKDVSLELGIDYTNLCAHINGSKLIKNFPYDLEYIDTKENK